MEDRLVSMIRQQRELQHRMGLTFTVSPNDKVRRVAHIKDMALAAIKEIGEALDEVSWKPWTTGEPVLRKHAVGGELSDAFQFIMNMWFAAYPELSDEDLADRMITTLEAKLAVNEARRVSGYDGESTKCGACRRALDDPAVSCTRQGDHGWCAENNADVNYIRVTGGEDAHLKHRDTVAS